MRKLLARLFPRQDFRTDAEALRDLHDELSVEETLRDLLTPHGLQYHRNNRPPETSIEALARMVS